MPLLANEPDAQHPQQARPGRAAAMIAPIIILGAITVLVVWDTADRN